MPVHLRDHLLIEYDLETPTATSSAQIQILGNPHSGRGREIPLPSSRCIFSSCNALSNVAFFFPVLSWERSLLISYLASGWFSEQIETVGESEVIAGDFDCLVLKNTTTKMNLRVTT